MVDQRPEERTELLFDWVLLQAEKVLGFPDVPLLAFEQDERQVAC